MAAMIALGLALEVVGLILDPPQALLRHLR
jgi:hypothetical protein